MTRTWTVARRELRSFFDQPTAYVLVVAFLGLGLYLTFRSLYGVGAASLRPFFDLLPWLFMVFVPAVTMRSLAEERRGKTLDWLVSQPLSEVHVLAGKFLGNWLFVLIALAGTLPTAIGILWVSEADAGIMLAQYVGAGLLAGLMIALGLWASSVTRNQITAFILAAALGFVLILIGTPVVQIGLPRTLGAVLSQLAVLTHFQNVARGVIDLRDLLYFVSMAGLFLLLAYGALARDRLSHGRAAFRRLRLGTLVLAAGVVVLNLLGGYIRGRLDLTRDNVYTLSAGSRDVLGSLDDLVTLTLFVSDELPQEVQLTLRDVRDLAADLRRAGAGNLVTREVDPDQDEEVEEEASSLGIYPIEFNVLRDDELQVRRGWFGLALTYADEQEVIPVIDRTDDLEFRLVSAIASMTAERRPRLAFTSGFGTRGAFQFGAFRSGLEGRFEISTVALDSDSITIDRDSVDVLVVAAPTEPLTEGAVGRLRAYLDQGGSALLLLENARINPQMPIAEPLTTGLDDLLLERGVELGEGLAFDLTSSERISMGQRGIFSVVRSYPLWPVAFRGGDHPTIRDLSNVTMAWAAPFTIRDSASVQPLWTTTEAAGVRAAGASIDPSEDFLMSPGTMGVQILAVAVDPGAAAEASDDEPRGAGGRMVVVGDAEFLEDRFVQANPQNLLFAANAVDWLAQDEGLIGIRSKVRTPPPLVFASDFGQSALKWGSMVGVPLLFILLGALRVTGRRARAEKRWKEMMG